MTQLVGDAERLARAALLRATEPTQAVINESVVRHGAVATVAQLRAGVGFGKSDVAGMQARMSEVSAEGDLERAAAVGARLVVPGDAEWPPMLDDLNRFGLASLGLYVRGRARLDETVSRAVAIVGTRAASEYGSFVASTLGAELAASGWAVVSGLAFGIDAAAHRGAISVGAGGAGTVAVLASGVDVTYPRSHESLLGRVLETGLVVSEQAPGCAPHRTRFLIRNRLIAALSAGTVVVEAAARSGARSTAKYAGMLGRPVMAVPGRITSVESIGCHQMLRDDPTVGLLTRVDDVLEMVGPMGMLAPRAQAEPVHRDQLTAIQATVLDALPAIKAADLVRIAKTAAVSIERAQAILGELLAAGFVTSSDGEWRLSESSASSRRRAKQVQPPALELDWW